MAQELVDLCRLARLPHEIPGLVSEPMNPRQALFFDLTMIRAAREARLYEASEQLHRTRENDSFGTLGIQALALLQQSRS